MDKQSIEEIRYIDSLLVELLDLDLEKRGDRLAKLQRDSPAVAQELRRLLNSCAGDDSLHAAGALGGVLAQECLLGRPAEPPLQAGAEIGPYRIDALLGRGGMAYVYRASRHFDGFVQQVALKLMRSGQFDESFRTRLLLEQRALVRLDHPNIARFLDAGLALDSDAYLAMELVEGRPITEHANEIGADLRTRVRWMIDLCAALSHAHGQLIVHCDIKPSNVLVDRKGRLRLLDFGIARIMGEAIDGAEGVNSVKSFTPDCAAPEQLTDAAATTATDVFQVGALLYRLIVGKPWLLETEGLDRYDLDAITVQVPFAPSRRLRDDCFDSQVMASALACGFHSPQALAQKVRGSLDAIVLKCLAKQPAERYSSIEQLGNDLQNWLRQRPVSVTSTSTLARLKLFLNRNLKAVAFATVALSCILLVAFVAMGRVATERAAKAREEERARTVERFLTDVFLQASPFLRESQTNALETLSRVGDSLLASEQNLDSRTRVRLAAALGRLEIDVGRPDLAERRARTALLAVGKVGVAEPDAVFELRRLLGLALARQDRLGEAIHVLEDKATQTSALTVNRVRRAQFGTLIGDLHRREGRLQDAQKYFQPALAILLDANVSLDGEQIEALSRVVAYIDQSGKEMEQLQSISSRLTAPPLERESAILRAKRLMLVSYVELLTGQPTPSAVHAKEAGAIFSSTLGEDHPQVTKARAMACTSFRDGGSLVAARQQCASALQSLKRQDRASSDDATVVRLNLAGIQFSSGNFVAAQSLLTNVLPTLGAESVPYQYAFASIMQGRLYTRRGQAREALEHFRHAADVQRKHYPDHIEFAAHIGQHMASSLIAADKLNEAERLLAETDPAQMPAGLLRDRQVADRLLVQGRLAAARGQSRLAKERTELGLSTLAKLSALSQNERAWALLDAGENFFRIGEKGAATNAFKLALTSGLSAQETPALWAWAVIRLEQLSVSDLTADELRKAERIRLQQFGSESLVSLPVRSARINR